MVQSHLQQSPSRVEVYRQLYKDDDGVKEYIRDKKLLMILFGCIPSSSTSFLTLPSFPAPIASINSCFFMDILHRFLKIRPTNI